MGGQIDPPPPQPQKKLPSKSLALLGLKLKTDSKLHSIPVPSNVMKKVGVSLCVLPEVDGYCYFIVCIDYFRSGLTQSQ